MLEAIVSDGTGSACNVRREAFVMKLLLLLLVVVMVVMMMITLPKRMMGDVVRSLDSD